MDVEDPDIPNLRHMDRFHEAPSDVIKSTLRPAFCVNSMASTTIFESSAAFTFPLEAKTPSNLMPGACQQLKQNDHDQAECVFGCQV